MAIPAWTIVVNGIAWNIARLLYAIFLTVVLPCIIWRHCRRNRF